jgi:hypothetical protein
VSLKEKFVVFLKEKFVVASIKRMIFHVYIHERKDLTWLSAWR